MPCKYLEDLGGKNVFKPLLNRSGLNCRIVFGGTVAKETASNGAIPESLRCGATPRERGNSARTSARSPTRRDADARTTGHAARLRVRSGEHTGRTFGMALGFAPGNVVILPAGDFLPFCQSNPKPSLSSGLAAGRSGLPALGADVGVRHRRPRATAHFPQRRADR